MAVQRAVCIVRDEALSKKEFVVEPSLPVLDFRKMVAENFEQEVEELDLFLQNSLCSLTIIDHTKDTLCDTGIVFDPDVRNNIMIMTKKAPRQRTRRERKYEDLDYDDKINYKKPPREEEQVAESRNEVEIQENRVEKPTTDREESPSRNTYISSLRSGEYIGLKNTSNYCYLNSVLQLFYMTPEFRNAVFNWPVTFTDQDDQLLIQLQKLFAQLRLSGKRAISIQNFVKSFTWSQTRQQQDISEFITLLFSSIRKTLAKKNIDDIIKTLYEGTITNYIQCLGCNNEKNSDSEFIDVQLALKNEKDETIQTVEEAVKYFLQPEELNGNNKYHCSNCNNLCDAKKGQKFKSIPHIVNFFLIRLSFDKMTGSLVKINDKVEYPQTILLSDDEGEYEYELSGVIMHSGTAYAGHYFSYIKNMNTKLWYSFNDQSVMKITNDFVDRGYGGESSITGSLRNSNAYMLTYRKMNSQTNEQYTEICDFPFETKDRLFQYMTEENESIISINLFYEKDGELLQKELHFNAEKSVGVVRDSAYNYFIREGSDEDDYKLATYDPVSHKVIEYLENKSAVLSELADVKNLLLQKKEENKCRLKHLNILQKYNLDRLDTIYVPRPKKDKEVELKKENPVESIEKIPIVEDVSNYEFIYKTVDKIFTCLLTNIHKFSYMARFGEYERESKRCLGILANFSIQGFNVMLLDKDVVKNSCSTMFKLLRRTENLKMIKKSFSSKDCANSRLPFVHYLRSRAPKRLYFILKLNKNNEKEYTIDVGFLEKN